MAEDTTGKVEHDEQDMIDEGAPVTPETDPELTDTGADSGAEAGDSEADAELAAEEKMVAEGAPVSAETEPTPDEAAASAETEGDEAGDSDYRRRLREYTKELKKLPGQWYIIQS